MKKYLAAIQISIDMKELILVRSHMNALFVKRDLVKILVFYLMKGLILVRTHMSVLSVKESLVINPVC